MQDSNIQEHLQQIAACTGWHPRAVPMGWSHAHPIPLMVLQNRYPPRALLGQAEMWQPCECIAGAVHFWLSSSETTQREDQTTGRHNCSGHPAGPRVVCRQWSCHREIGAVGAKWPGLHVCRTPLAAGASCKKHRALSVIALTCHELYPLHS